MIVDAYWTRDLADGGIPWHGLSEPVTLRYLRSARSAGNCRGYEMAPPAGFEPAHTAPEADALSPELWGLRDVGKATSHRAFADTQPRHAPGHPPGPGARSCAERLPSRE